MNSFRKWLYKPKKTDNTYLAQFYFADEELNLVAAELDSFDGRKDPERCTMLVNQLRLCQDKVLTVIQKIMDDAIPEQRANRDFRVKFPDDVLQDSLAGQLWFGAECLAAGSSILNREVESASMRPLARVLTKNLDSLRGILRDQCLRSCTEYTERIKEALVIFDKLFAEFELSYVSAMVPVKTMKEYDLLQEVTVLFSETVQRALEKNLLSQDMIDYCDPALMFTIPRLAIVCGLLIYPEGPLNPDMEPSNMTEMYRPFQTLLQKIRELLYTLSSSELELLEKALCSSEEPDVNTAKAVGTSSQSEAFSQVDQGFHEGGEGIVPLDLIGLNIAEHSSNSSSPLTPIGLIPDELDQVSPSTTLVENLIDDLGNCEVDEGSLNKSESQDSGLQSENVSTSDTVPADCPPLVSHDQDGTTECHVTSGGELENTEKEPKEVKLGKDSKDVDVAECDKNDEIALTEQSTDLTESNFKDFKDEECDMDREIRNICREMVENVVINAVHYLEGASANISELTELTEVCNIQNGDINRPGEKCSDINKPGETNSDSDMVDVKVCDKNDSQDADDVGQDHTDEHGVSRQFSWQYNVQFALPQLSLTDHDSSDRQSSESFSSDSTISEGAGQQTSVSDFVIETLANMNMSSENVEDRKPEKVSSSSQTDQRIASCSSKSSRHRSSRDSQKQQSDSHTRSDIRKTKTKANGSRSNVSSQSSLDRLSKNGRKHKPKSKRRSGRDSVENISCGIGTQSQSRSNTSKDSSKITAAELKALQKLKYAETSSCSSGPSSDCDSDTQCSCLESETSSYNSESNDDEEIALAIQAAEAASRSEARSRFRSSSDLIHRLFVCIAGVADQLQTNYASDLRHILKCVFELNTESPPEVDNEVSTPVVTSNDQNVPSDQGNQLPSSQSQQLPSNQNSPSNQSPPHSNRSSVQPSPSSPRHRQPASPRRIFKEPPEWVPDEEVEKCTSCKTPFTFVRRRHHCRNCGKIFCGKCSSTTVPLPQYGHQKPVRVCHRCFLYQVSHFTVTSDM